MLAVFSPSGHSLFRLVLPALVLGAMLVATLGAFVWAIDRERDRVRDSHRRVAQAAVAELNETIEGTIGGLRGLRGLHDANAKLSPRQFEVASDAVLDQHELLGTQWVMSVRRSMRRMYERQHDRRLTVIGEQGRRSAPDADQWAAVTYVAPRRLHRRAEGLDHLSNGSRRPALNRARDLGSAQLSEPNLLGVPGRPLGIMIFLPVYERGAAVETVAERREAHRGWVAGVYQLDRLSRSVFADLPPGSCVEVIAGGESIISFGPGGDSGAPQPIPVGSGVSQQMTVAGQTWIVRAQSHAGVSWLTPLTVLAIGLLGTLLVALLIVQSRRRELSMMSLLDERRERQAVEAALTATEERNRTIVDSAPDGIVTTDADGRIQSMNPAAERMFEREAAEVDGRSASVLFALPENAVRYSGGVSGVLRRAATSGDDADLIGLRNEVRFPVEVRVSAMRATGGLTLVARDVSEQRLAEAEERALRTVATKVAEGAAPEIVFDLVAAQAGELYGAFGSYVVRCDSDAGTLVGRWGAFVDHDVRTFSPADDHTCARVARSGVASMTRDYANSRASGMGRYGIRSAIAAPVRVDGELWGVVGVASGLPDAFRPGSERHLERFAEFVSMAIANADARARLVAWAATDELTGLPNQRTFHERLATEVERAHRHGHRVSLALFDVDRFKAVNDGHGHQAGDRVLIEIADRLRGIMRTSDTVARIGGEEFGWIMVETDGLGAWRAADRARAAIESTPFPDVGLVTVSGGICELSPSGNAGEIFRLADVALYWAKAHGRNVCFRYSPDVIEVLSAEERSAQMERIQRVGSIMGLARAVDAKDASTQRHSERVAALAARLARELGWPEPRAALLHEAALVHDVGKIALPDAILVKPGALTESEYEQVKMHAELGARIVEGCLSIDQVAWVRGHHERFDGRGYPDRISGTEISEGARILALADAWDAMTEVRLYRGAMSLDDALQEVLDNSGSQFWPQAVRALERLARRGQVVVASDPANGFGSLGANGLPITPLGANASRGPRPLPGVYESSSEQM
jgi:diguanylate cyclase (GGDEF)-like protein/PAS domain S-box-containing protein